MFFIKIFLNRTWVLVIFILSCSFIPLKSQQLVLTSNGASLYKIVIPAQSSDEIIKAANILQEYLKKNSGASLPVIPDTNVKTGYEIILGRTNRGPFLKDQRNIPSLRNDGYWIKSINKKLFIYGESDQGVIFGVTSFLEDYLHCRKYTPEVEKIPKTNNLVIGDIDDLQIPSADIRIIYGVTDTEFMNWRKLGTPKGWGGPYFVHTFQNLIPADEYFQQHPEYFSMVRGKRIADGQLCLSNPALIRLAVERLRTEMEKLPEIVYWSVSQNDNQRACECPECKVIDSIEGSPSGTLLRFVNQVADSFPDKIITTLAYQYTRKPPKVTRPAKNVMVTLCSIELNRSEPIRKDPSAKSFRKDIRGWSKICRNLMIWDYEVQFTNYLCPFPLFYNLQPNLKFFNKYNVHAYFLQADVYKGVESAELKAYLLSKLLWNPTIRVNDVLNDFFKGYYENAAPYITEYFNLLHANAAKTEKKLNSFGSPVWYANTFLSEENLKKYNTLFDQAEAIVAGNPEILQRVKVARLPIMYAALEIAKADPFRERGWFNVTGDRIYAPKPAMQLMLKELVEICKVNNIQYLREGGLTADQYSEKSLKMMDIHNEGNLAFRKPVVINPLPEKRYSYPGPGKLTNGVQGSEDFRLGYLGWKGVDPLITIDLQKDTILHKIIVSTYQSSILGILHPLSVAFYVSEDGNKYENVGTVRSEQNQDKQMTKMQFTLQQKAMKARYVRIKVENNKTLPDWHPDAGKPCWVFIDQVEVR